MKYVTIDFETYSEAGYEWEESAEYFIKPGSSDSAGLQLVGSAVYAEHPSTEVLCMAYKFSDRGGVYVWEPNMSLPQDLMSWAYNGGLIEAWNCAFERQIWEKVCVPRYGFQRVKLNQWRDAAAKARAYALPSKLAKVGEVISAKVTKDKGGVRLINKFSIPRTPTAKDNRIRITFADDTIDAEAMRKYNAIDVLSEIEISNACPELNEFETRFWLCDQAINARGVQIDLTTINNAIELVEQYLDIYTDELCSITEGTIKSVNQTEKLRKWCNQQGASLDNLRAETIEKVLQENTLPGVVLRALKIRQLAGSAAVKKLYAMKYQACSDGRLRELFIYHKARTGRAAGEGPQPQNLPNSGPMVRRCTECGFYSDADVSLCICCLNSATGDISEKFNSHAAEAVIACINSRRYDVLDTAYPDPLEAIGASLRSMFIAAPGHELICSDYSAIEAVVLAAIAGEEWRLNVFRTHGKIYEMSAAKITGMPFDEFESYYKTTGTHHEYRNKVGKVAELASGYGGWLGAWKQFGADKFFNEDEIKRHIIAWRNASPAIVEFWGGQERHFKPELYGIEGTVIKAIQTPNTHFEYKNIGYFYDSRCDVLLCCLPSSRMIAYHKPRLEPAELPRRGLKISYEGWNTNPKNGQMNAWIRMHTYGGKLVENIVQAIARDILANAIVNLEIAGYPIVLHVHDEIVAEIQRGFGSLQEFERIMSTMPHWAVNWPIVAKGGWRGERYRK